MRRKLAAHCIIKALLNYLETDRETIPTNHGTDQA